ncbi:histidine phosphatase family protein [Corynebacterium caspium]|uniref:histidine phosphatase family protein n=1 Tax=Corynebacterium caspium TaxID=234828 RepID=UPI00037E3153|nr:histidine phosphatase family protein [Corynebacterium caspium]WKD58856.1 Glucosyl-3-phosphoglycerate phosphatase [Corynebacterium caspium DSM 44850]
MTRTLIMVRHGQTEYNATKRMQGHLDTRLSAQGYAEARGIGRLLAAEKSLPVSRIITSDLTRAAETAKMIGAELGLEPELDHRLRETDLGQWQGQSRDEVDAAWPGARAIWRHDATWAPPGGESRVDVAARALPVVTELMQHPASWENGAIVLVAHSGTIISLASALLGFSPEQIPLLSGMNNCHMARLSARPLVEYLGKKPEDLPTTAPQFSDTSDTSARWYLDAWNVGV